MAYIFKHAFTRVKHMLQINIENNTFLNIKSVYNILFFIDNISNYIILYYVCLYKHRIGTYDEKVYNKLKHTINNINSRVLLVVVKLVSQIE